MENLDRMLKEWTSILTNIDSMELKNLPNLSFEVLPSKLRLKKAKENKVLSIEYTGMPRAGKTSLLINSMEKIFKETHLITLIPEFANLPKEARRKLSAKHLQLPILNYFYAKSKLNNYQLSLKYGKKTSSDEVAKTHYVINERGVNDLLLGEITNDVFSYGRLSKASDDMYPNYFERQALRRKVATSLLNVDVVILGDVSMNVAGRRRADLENDKQKRGTLINSDYFLAAKVAQRYWLAKVMPLFKKHGIGVFAFDGDKSFEKNAESLYEYCQKLEYESKSGSN